MRRKIVNMLLDARKPSGSYQQPYEDRRAFKRRLIRDVRDACVELDYENDTDRSSIERVEQVIEWLRLLVKDEPSQP